MLFKLAVGTSLLQLSQSRKFDRMFESAALLAFRASASDETWKKPIQKQMHNFAKSSFMSCPDQSKA